jgi:hypothetical protein
MYRHLEIEYEYFAAEEENMKMNMILPIIMKLIVKRNNST